MIPVVLFHVGTGQYVECVESWALTTDREDAAVLDQEDAREVLREYRRSCNARCWRRGLDRSLQTYAEQWVMDAA
jgi:hypothetical protein